MGTLNQYAARITNMVNQPNNHELKERVKDMIKLCLQIVFDKALRKME
jgi:hypothetical protein